MIEGSFCVTGATGFVGGHLVAELVARGASRTTVLTRRPCVAFAEPVRVVTGTLTDVARLGEFLQPEATVVNLAFDPRWSHEEALDAARCLAGACVKAHVRGVIHVSTAVVVGSTADRVVTEDTPCAPANGYEKTKLEVEQVLLQELRSHCNIVIVRPTAVFGEGGQNLIKVAAELTRGSALKRWLRGQVYNGRSMNLVYVGNIVDALVHLSAIQDRVNQERFIISDDDDPLNNYASVVEVLAHELRSGGPRLPHVPGAHLLLPLLLRIRGRSSANPFRRFNSTKLFETGWQKPFTLAEGLRRFATWYREAGSE
jgi:nucleoside-diphosphate-sugar epimerase